MELKTYKRRSYNEPGHAHELTFSCYRGFPFLKAERTCQWLSESIEEARLRLDFAVWAYVFMPDHVHMIVCPRKPDYEVSTILRTIKEPVGRRATAYLAWKAPEWLPRITQVRGRQDRTPLLAAGRRVRSQHHRAEDPLGHARLHPPEPGSTWFGDLHP